MTDVDIPLGVRACPNPNHSPDGPKSKPSLVFNSGSIFMHGAFVYVILAHRNMPIPCVI